MVASSIQTFVDTIAAKASIDPAAAETAVGTILSIIEQEGDAPKVAELFNKIPGAEDLAHQHAVVAGGGGGLLGALSSVAESVAGNKVGLLVSGLAQIEATGLSMQQIKTVGSAFLVYAKESANPALVTQIINSIPGLKDQFPH